MQGRGELGDPDHQLILGGAPLLRHQRHASGDRRDQYGQQREDGATTHDRLLGRQLRAYIGQGGKQRQPRRMKHPSPPVGAPVAKAERTAHGFVADTVI
jgi:hypothetical protein